jgi:protein tyrosine/serine phosphatase
MVMMKILAASLLLLFVWTSRSPGQVPMAGTTLIRFGQVDEGVYKGSKPRTDADYRFLQSRHIKYIVDLQFVPFLDLTEQKQAKRHGMGYIRGHINASPVSPSQKHVETILAILRDRRHHPVYFHCALGRDRTNLIAALYKIYFLGMSEQGAMRYMNESGYKDGWVRSGLKRYLREHPSPSPAWRRRLAEEKASDPGR